MSAAGDDTSGRPRRRRMEIFAFLFLTAVLMPAAAVATVGGYGSRSGLSDAGRSARPSRALSPAFSGKIIVARPHTAIDRRALITGRLLRADQVVAPPGGEIASILVQARPESLTSVEAAIVALAGCEIYGRDPKGKLVVVVDAPDAGALGSTLNTIALLPDVYTASLVFHAIDAS
jgi:nitrate reductase NapD